MKISTFNINGIRARLETVLRFLKESTPDIVLLQEIKCATEIFPREIFEDLGFNVHVHGQKSFNGVAILSKLPFGEIRDGLEGDATDTQSRFVEAEIAGLTIGALYLPNGNPYPGEKFDYKLAFMERLYKRAETLIKTETPFLLAGDFNVIPTPLDCYDPAAWEEDALYRPETRAAFRRLLNLGLADVYRLLHPDETAYSFWDFQKGAWPKNNGIRIDHFLLSPELVDRVMRIEIERDWRGQDHPSDHVPVSLELKDYPPS